MSQSTVNRGLISMGYWMLSSGLHPPPRLIQIINEFSARKCLRDLIQRFEINCVLDVGAHTGAFALILRRIGYEGHIVCFEPNPESFRKLCKRFKADRFWRGMNIALGSKNTTQSFNITREPNLSSFLTPRTAAIDHVLSVKVTRLDSIFEDVIHSIDAPRVFMKMDTQGCDVDVVKGAGACIHDILGMQSEISVQPIYENMPYYLDALRYYESCGFELVNLFSAYHNKKYGNIIEYDCLMARLNRVFD